MPGCVALLGSVREFTMAEIEHFVKQDEKDHIFFEDVKDVRLVLFPRENQVGDGKTVRVRHVVFLFAHWRQWGDCGKDELRYLAR